MGRGGSPSAFVLFAPAERNFRKDNFCSSRATEAHSARVGGRLRMSAERRGAAFARRSESGSRVHAEAPEKTARTTQGERIRSPRFRSSRDVSGPGACSQPPAPRPGFSKRARAKADASARRRDSGRTARTRGSRSNPTRPTGQQPRAFWFRPLGQVCLRRAPNAKHANHRLASTFMPKSNVCR